jgi:signal transduction histidine kinase
MTVDEARHLRHELRVPVNHLFGYADLLLDEGDLPPGISTHLADVRSLAEQVAKSWSGGSPCRTHRSPPKPSAPH